MREQEGKKGGGRGSLRGWSVHFLVYDFSARVKFHAENVPGATGNVILVG